ncbi:MAG: hypothetical protein GY928_30965 [Colwellia sp.]|nr:hypothetical protein [Colwellia sp.]
MAKVIRGLADTEVDDKAINSMPNKAERILFNNPFVITFPVVAQITMPPFNHQLVS